MTDDEYMRLVKTHVKLKASIHNLSLTVASVTKLADEAENPLDSRAMRFAANLLRNAQIELDSVENRLARQRQQVEIAVRRHVETPVPGEHLVPVLVTGGDRSAPIGVAVVDSLPVSACCQFSDDESDDCPALTITDPNPAPSIEVTVSEESSDVTVTTVPVTTVGGYPEEVGCVQEFPSVRDLRDDPLVVL